MLTKETERALMAETVREAALSVSEDGRIHPKVGAILASPNGEILCRAHRGESRGAHAEFCLLEKAARLGVQLDKTILFTSLEPCTQRGENKLPCVERVAATPIPTVYIGTLDPNPSITGRSEMFLAFIGKEVRRFDGEYHDALWRLNDEFFEQHRAQYVESLSLYMPLDPALWQTQYGNRIIHKLSLSNERNSLMLQTIDLIFGSHGDIWRSAGGLSWFRECYVTYFCAAIAGRQIRLLCSGATLVGKEEARFREAISAAQSVGCFVGVAPQPPRLRSTLVSPHSDSCAVILIDGAAPHLYHRASDPGVVELLAEQFDHSWARSSKLETHTLKWEELSNDALVAALRRGVPQYRDAAVSVESVGILDLKFPTTQLERFKLHRLQQLSAIQRLYNLPMALRIHGSPWPITPPVIEIQKDGSRVIVDGAHRIYSAFLRREGSTKAILVEGVTAPLPTQSLNDVHAVGYYDKKLRRDLRYSGYQSDAFRPVRAAFAALCK